MAEIEKRKRTLFFGGSGLKAGAGASGLASGECFRGIGEVILCAQFPCHEQARFPIQGWKAISIRFQIGFRDRILAFAEGPSQGGIAWLE